MKAILGFSKTNSIYSKIIRFLDGGEISHVYLRIFDEFFGVWLIIHSDWGGVQVDLAEKFDLENITTEEYEIEDEDLHYAIVKNLWHLGKGYSYIKLFNWTWAIIFKRWFVRKIKDPITDPKKLICVDFILYILNAAHITHLSIGSLTPNELRLWCRSYYEELGWQLTIK